MWSIWLWVFPSEEIQLYLWMFRCGNIVLLTTRFYDVAKYTILTPSSLLSWCRLAFPIVGLKIFSLSSFALISPNRIFMWAGWLSRYSDWLRAGRSGIESRWGRDFPPAQTGPGAYPASCKMGTGSFPGVKCGRGVLLTTHHLLVPRSWKSRSIRTYIYPPSGPHRTYNGKTLPF